MKYEKIPSKIYVGGQEIKIRRVERCDNNNLGTSFLAGGYIELADKCNKCDAIPERMKVNAFYHEVTHAILDTMGESDLSSNEKFVNCFAGFLSDAMTNAFFSEEEKK